MRHFIVFLLSSFLLISCSTKTTDKNIIPQNSIIITDITASDANTQVTPLNIALLVPLSGQDKNGSSLVQAAQMAVDEANSDDIILTVLDSNLLNSSPNSLLGDLEQQQAIIGPLYGADTQKLTNLINNKNIPILSLSNDSSLKADSLLIMGISPNNQTSTVINYAISHGINNFHLLLPENKFGHLVNATVESILSEKNGMRYTANWYENNDTQTAINQLVSNLDHNNSTQAVFIAQGDKKILSFLNKALAAHKSKVKLIGLQGWDNSEILHLNNLNGAIFLRKNLINQQFNHKFNSLFSANPNNLDYITYNSLLMIINMHNAKLALNKQSIIENNQEAGKYSQVQFNSEGLSLYNLPIAKVHDSEFVDIP